MNTNIKHNILHRWLPTIPALAALLALPNLALGQSAPTAPYATASGKMRVVAAAKAVDSVNGDKESVKEAIEVRVENGKLTVIRNGVEIPASQLKQDGNGIIILDQNGKKLEGSNIRMRSGGSGSGNLDYVISGAGESAPLVYDLLNVDPVAASKPALKVMLGVHMTDTGPALEYHLGLEHGKSTMITGVFEGLPAYDAGIRQYDIITRINGKAPADTTAIREAMADKNDGDTVALTIIHEGKSKDVGVKLQKYDAEAMNKAKLIGSAPEDQFSGAFSAFAPNAQWSGELSQIFVAPNADTKGRVELFTPEIQQHLKEHLEKAIPRVQHEGVENQLERLDKRMAELEAMLGKLIEQRQNNR